MELISLSLSAFWGFGFWSVLAWLFAGATIGLTFAGRLRFAALVFVAAVMAAISIFAAWFWRWDTAKYPSLSEKAIQGQAFGWIALALIGAFTWLIVIEVLLVFLRRRKIFGDKNS